MGFQGKMFDLFSRDAAVLQKVRTRVTNYALREIVRKKVPPSIFFADGRPNLGDSMVPWLISRVAGHVLPFSNPLQNRGDHLLSIGSILQYANADCHIWGSGFISETMRLKGIPRQVTAVRGPLTARRLEQIGIDSPNIYGDPGLLTSRFIDLEYRPVSGRIGLIPHFVDWEAASEFKGRIKGDVQVIDIRTDDVAGFCNKVVGCDIVISSSLHGIILSESFGVPAIWCEIGKDVVGNGFKFLDYFKSTGRDVEPASVTDLLTKDIFGLQISKIPNLNQMQDDLLAAFPAEFR